MFRTYVVRAGRLLISVWYFLSKRSRDAAMQDKLGRVSAVQAQRIRRRVEERRRKKRRR
jgi:hypothetical protein